MGYVTFTLAGGCFHMSEPLRNLADGLLIGLGGGLTVTLIFGALYSLMDWETDLVEKYVLKSYCVSQFTYAFVEGMYGLGIVDLNALLIISNVVYPICLYGYLVWVFINLYFGGDC